MRRLSLVLISLLIFTITVPAQDFEVNKATSVIADIVTIGSPIVGIASWYSNKLHGKRMANGDRYNKWKLTCAHRYLPFGTRLLVESLEGKSVILTVTDRGPFVKRRVLDVSYEAARELNILKNPSKVTIAKIAPGVDWRLTDGQAYRKISTQEEDYPLFRNELPQHIDD